MKMFIKSSMVVVIASVVMISCIDDSVSPEVQQARAAQVTYLTARADFQKAQADLAAAQAALQLTVNAEEEQDLRQQTASVDYQVAIYAANQKQQELALQQATDALAKYLADKGLNDALDYLNNYDDVLGTLSGLYSDKASKTADIAKAQLLIDANTNESFDLLKLEFQRDLATNQAELDAANAALASLVAVQADPSTAQTQLNAANATNADLTNKGLQLEIDFEKAHAVTVAAQQKATDAGQLISDYEQIISDLADNASQITDKTKQIADANVALTVANGELTAANTNLATAKTALDAKQALYNTAKANLDAKNNAVTVANANVVIAQANDNANSTPATQAALTAATNAQTAANTAQGTAQTDFNTAETNRDNAQNNFDNYNSIVNDPGGKKEVASDAADNVATLQAQLSALNVTSANLTEQKTAKDAAYTTAKANLESLKIAANTAANAETPITDAQAQNNTDLNANGDVITALEDFLDGGSGINTAIEAKKDEIEGLKVDVEQSQTDLADNDISKKEAQDKIASLQADLDNINAQIDANVALAAKFKALLDAAIAG